MHQLTGKGHCLLSEWGGEGAEKPELKGKVKSISATAIAETRSSAAARCRSYQKLFAMSFDCLNSKDTESARPRRDRTAYQQSRKEHLVMGVEEDA